MIDGADIDATQTEYFATHWMPLPSPPDAAQPPTHRCNGVNRGARHGTQNACTICGEYREGRYDSNGMEVLSPAASSPAVTPAEDAAQLGLFAVFYDGETRPVAGFVLEQDAERYAKQYSGGVSYRIEHVHVVRATIPAASDEVLDAEIPRS